MDPKNGGHVGKREFIGIKSFLTGPAIVRIGTFQLNGKFDCILKLYSFLSSFPVT